MRFIRLIIVCSGVLAAFNVWAKTASEQQYIHIRGSNTVMVFAQPVVETYMAEHPNVTITIETGETTRGIKAVIDGTAQIGMASADLTDSNIKFAQARNVQLERHVVAHDSLLPIVHPSNPVTNLSLGQLKKIYSGEITNWKQVGGRNAKIIVTSHDGSSGNYYTWMQRVMGGTLISPQAKIMASVAMRKFVSENRDAIGYFAMWYMSMKLNPPMHVKPVKVNGVEASYDTVKNVSYPISREMALYIRKDASAETKALVNYFLDPLKGQIFVREARDVAIH